jgi:FkbM family methyltransferase
MTARTSAALLENRGVRVKAGRHGLVAYSSHDTFVGRSIDLYGEWSPGDAALLARFVGPGMTVLDIGANIGTHTLFFAERVGESGRVLAFEPVAAIFRLLCCNVALNGLGQVRARPAGVGRVGGRVQVPAISLHEPANLGATTLTHGGEDEAAIVAIDELGLTACDLVKADVEGMEDEVIAGAERTIARCRPVLFLENEEPSLSPPLMRRLLALDYRLYWHAPPLFSPDNFFGNPTDVFPTLGSLNLLGLPAERGTVVKDLDEVQGPDDWPAWWPDWSSRGVQGGGA